MAAQRPNWRDDVLERNGLPREYLGSAQKWFDPVASLIAGHHFGAQRALLVAVNGCQGSGKSTLCDYLQALFREEYGLACVALSLDDFYLTAAQRKQLASDVHPLFATRGVPGTHDMGLLASTLDALLAGAPVTIPRFDKAADDRRPAGDRVGGPVQLVLLEGWCLGAVPQSLEELAAPVNALEAEEDRDGRWRRRVNAALAEQFSPLYPRVDEWIMLRAPDFACVYRWRLEQEQKLAARRAGDGVMDAGGIGRFIQYYQRLTEHCLRHLPARVNHLFNLDQHRAIHAYLAAPGVRP